LEKLKVALQQEFNELQANYKQWVTNFQTIPIAEKMTSPNWKQMATQNALKLILYDNFWWITKKWR
jgi:hypothetical protein